MARKEWVKRMVSVMIPKLKLMSLKWAPAADTLEEVEDVWVMTFIASGSAREEDMDIPRFRQAFGRLIGNPDLTDWPSPQDILRLLPPRPPEDKAKALPGLTEAETLQIEALSSQHKEENAKRALKLMQDIVAGKVVNRGEIVNEKVRSDSLRRNA